MASTPPNYTPESLFAAYQLALRASLAAGAASDPSDKLAFWTRLITDLDFTIATVHKLGFPLRNDMRLVFLGSCVEAVESTHKTVSKLRDWTAQVHRTLAAQAQAAAADMTEETADAATV